MKKFVSLVAVSVLLGVATVGGQGVSAGKADVSCAVLRSGVVEQVAYDESSKTLSVRFHSGWLYSYDGVEAAVFSGLVNAATPGAFFVKNIRGKYPARRVAFDARLAGVSNDTGNCLN